MSNRFAYFAKTPKRVIICEHPSQDDAWTGTPFRSPDGEKFRALLASLDPKWEQNTTVLYRIPEPQYRKKGDASVIATLIKKHTPGFLRALSTQPEGAPVLYLGHDTLTDRSERYLIEYLPTDGRCLVDTLDTAYSRTPQKRWLFERTVRDWWSNTPRLDVDPQQTELGVTERALELLRAMEGEISYDIETLGKNPDVDPITSFGLSDGLLNVVVPWDTYSTGKHGQVPGLDSYGELGLEIRAEVIRLVTERPTITHNGTYDAGGLRPRGIPARLDFDLMAAYQTLYAELPSNLEFVAKAFARPATAWKTIYNPIKRENKKLPEDEQIAAAIKRLGYAPYVDSPWDTLAMYNARDCFYTWHAAKAVREEMELAAKSWYPNCKELIAAHQVNLEIAWQTRRWGWHLDQKRVERLKRYFDRRVVQTVKKLRAILPPDIKASSPAQLSKLMYKVYNEPILHKTSAGNPTVAKDALQWIAKFGISPVARDVAKLCITLAKWKTMQAGLKPFIGQEIVRAGCLPAKQLTGRWSYFNPPLTNIHPLIRTCFVARPGCKMVAADWKAAEQRMIAVVAGDRTMLDDINNDFDMHGATAIASMGIDKNLVLSEAWQKHPLRKVAKVIGFNTNYSGLKMEGTAKTLLKKFQAGGLYNLSEMQIFKMLQRLWSTRKEIWALKTDSWKDALRDGYVEEHIHGRRRFFHQVDARDTECANMRIQGAVAALAQNAMHGIYRELDHTCEGILLLKHDEIILEGPDPQRLKNLLTKYMKVVVQYKDNEVLFDIDAEVGVRWGAWKHI